MILRRAHRDFEIALSLLKPLFSFNEWLEYSKVVNTWHYLFVMLFLVGKGSSMGYRLHSFGHHLLLRNATFLSRAYKWQGLLERFLTKRAKRRMAILRVRNSKGVKY